MAALREACRPRNRQKSGPLVDKVSDEVDCSSAGSCVPASGFFGCCAIDFILSVTPHCVNAKRSSPCVWRLKPWPHSCWGYEVSVWFDNKTAAEPGSKARRVIRRHRQHDDIRRDALYLPHVRVTGDVVEQ